MSIVNAWASESKAVLCVDTLGAQRGQFLQASKLIPYIHANVALAVQGSVDLLQGLFVAISQLGLDVELDEIEKQVPGLMRAGADALADHFASQGGDGEDPLLWPSKLFVAGWSNSRRRMTVLAFQLPANGGPAIATEAKPWLLAPGDVPALQGIELRPTGECFMEIARAQERAFVGQPGAVIGGRLVVAEITRDAMNIRTLGSI